MAKANTVPARLAAIEERLERVERLSYLCYVELRKVAEYAYLNVRQEEDAESIKRMTGMTIVSDHDAVASGMDIEDLVALKFKARFLAARCRKDALGIAKELADERKRRPAVPQRDEEVA